ncbi:hypothetical protein A9Q84_01980 [Halobacteriovorax marinus]|uniref:Spermatogenesis-associated protein 20-like TRX domain-containing protein n=1 Tax=Halobacteriovorax marinus TaxID=97084 RepID=A0A1Y5FCK7_9BACT|nr:hypothetical protein A9Q84_01980 [Halobacteriovorax marinus]
MKIFFLLSLLLCLSCKKQDPLKLPGNITFKSSLEKTLRKSVSDKGEKYIPRTKHLNPDNSPKFINRLILESSPYLNQHAHNPVNWYPWSKEAFEIAKKENKPIFLSIGYSTCHWCHVMEEESFDNIKVATYLNENYIAIKVDREQRPDVDSIYMKVVQAINGSGGWPMSLWLTPDKKPIYARTYIPAFDGDRGTKKGFYSILKDIRKIFVERKSDVEKYGNQITEALQSVNQKSIIKKINDQSLVKRVLKNSLLSFDPIYGGVNRSPKFPSSFPLSNLIQNYSILKNKSYLNMITKTLDEMAKGGIHDHIDGGFHRYSTDKRWLAPHFEKMLYDNAFLTDIYTKGFLITKKKSYEYIVNSTINFMLEQMYHKEIGFFCAIDADSKNHKNENEEGYFYTWGLKELSSNFPKAKQYWNIPERGNFEGRTILTLKNLDHLNLETSTQYDLLRKNISSFRLNKPFPIVDRKSVVAWNAMVIHSLATSGFHFKNKFWTNKAVEVAELIWNRQFVAGELYRIFLNSRPQTKAFLEDYAYLIKSYITLFETTSNQLWLDRSIQLVKILNSKFMDQERGGYYISSIDHELILAKDLPTHDGAYPNGNSIMAMNLVKLYDLTLNKEYFENYNKLIERYSVFLEGGPSSLSEMVRAMEAKNLNRKQVVIITSKTPGILVETLRQNNFPQISYVIAKENSSSSPLLKDKRLKKNRETAYVCKNFICNLPTGSVQTLLKQIRD